MTILHFEPTLAGWQAAARRALQLNLSPPDLLWEPEGGETFLLPLHAALDREADHDAVPVQVPRTFMKLAKQVVCHADPNRWPLLYRVLWRLIHGERHLLSLATDPEIHQLQQMNRAVHQEIHKMRAFLRFRMVEDRGSTRYVAWFEPRHAIVRMDADFYVDRYANLHWSILTPDCCAHWDGQQLRFTKGAARSDGPAGDAVENLWLTYYAHTFNPARVKVKAMESEMPRRYWQNLPEASLIRGLLQEAPSRVDSMMKKSRALASAPVEVVGSTPATSSWEQTREAARSCQNCELYRHATQTVFGEGPRSARLVLLGEQPGDREDELGRPFVGPAGQLLDRALAEAGIDRSQVYVTNSVKHFKWEQSGTRRLHKKPSAREVAACQPWLEAEMRLIAPEVLVCLGSTAAQNILGPQIRVLRDRGRFYESSLCSRILVTVHPSSLLRAPDEETRARDYQHFVADLRLAS